MSGLAGTGGVYSVAVMKSESDPERSQAKRTAPRQAVRRARAAGDVLITDGGDGQNRSALAAVRALGAAGYRAVVTVSGSDSLAAASRHCSRRVTVPAVGDDRYVAAVRAEVASREYVCVLPASDAALVALAAEGMDLVDKAKLAERAAAAGLDVPPGRLFATAELLLAAAGELDYPVVVKSSLKTSSGQRPARVVDSASALTTLTGIAGPFIVQRFIDGAMHAIAGVMWDGRLVAAVHQEHVRIWPAECGDASAARTTEADRELESSVAALLAGYNGIFQAEFVGSTLLDINPRVYASLPLAAAAGANLAGLYCELRRGGPAPRTTLRARTGVEYRWLEGDVRHLYGRWRGGDMSAWSAMSALAAGTTWRAISLDPAPVVVRARYAVRRLAARREGAASLPNA
jgi:predicted ATP-grasp superfamily ATP-dependent carboligase